jgi:hypothetical protein
MEIPLEDINIRRPLRVQAGKQTFQLFPLRMKHRKGHLLIDGLTRQRTPRTRCFVHFLKGKIAGRFTRAKQDDGAVWLVRLETALPGRG